MKDFRPLVERAVRRALSSWSRSTWPIPTFSRMEKPFRKADLVRLIGEEEVYISLGKGRRCVFGAPMGRILPRYGRL
jgi:hypothetical protein